MGTNYVYAKHKGGYKPELAQKLPEAPSLPGCFEACAKFISVLSGADDATRETTAAKQEKEDAKKGLGECEKKLAAALQELEGRSSM